LWEWERHGSVRSAHCMQAADHAKLLTGHVLVQREMESGRFAIASVPPLRGGDFQGMGKSIEVEEEGEDGG